MDAKNITIFNAEIDKAIEKALINIPKWQSSDGRVLELTEIDDRYLRNIHNYLLTKAPVSTRNKFLSHVEKELERRLERRKDVEKVVEKIAPEMRFTDKFLEALKKVEDK